MMKFALASLLVSLLASYGVEANKHWLACGKRNKCEEAPYAADKTEKHELRCCKDSAASWWVKKGGCTVWGKSKFGSKCYHAKNYEDGEAICESAGGRLCTKKELEDGCTEGTGCGHDRDLIWSSTADGLVCGAGEVEYVLEILTDSNPGQTTWSFRMHMDTSVVVKSGGGYELGNTQYQETGCLPKDCLHFMIEDSGGDGICCSAGGGSYSLTVGDVVVASNRGDFLSNEMSFFGTCCSPTNTECQKSR